MVEDSGDAVAGVADMGEGSMTLCNKHPYKNNRTNPGGICAFCLQEKLGKLVSSSLPVAVFPSSSTSSASHSFRSESSNGGGHSAVSARSVGLSSSSMSCQKKPRIPFLSYHRRKKESCTAETEKSNGSVIFKRSKSTTTPSGKYLDRCENRGDHGHLQKKWFWSSSFWYHPKRGSGTRSSTNGSARATPSASFSHRSKDKHGVVLAIGRGIEADIPEEEDEEDDNNNSPGSHVTTSTTTSFGRKVSRSRSVGCGSRSFSGDFFERISTGLGDCTLRRVESQREGHNNKSKVADSCMKQRVRCGGIFGGFIVTSSSSSSSSQWLPPSAVNPHQLVHGKGRSWSWAFASPIRAFSKPSSSSSGKSDNSSIATTTPNLSAMPSLLSISNK